MTIEEIRTALVGKTLCWTYPDGERFSEEVAAVEPSSKDNYYAIKIVKPEYVINIPKSMVERLCGHYSMKLPGPRFYPEDEVILNIN